MEVVVAAALIAVAVVVAALMYGRTHGPAAPATAAPDSATATALQAALSARGTALDRREDELAR